jgi:hypothetical protein
MIAAIGRAREPTTAPGKDSVRRVTCPVNAADLRERLNLSL